MQKNKRLALFGAGAAIVGGMTPLLTHGSGATDSVHFIAGLLGGLGLTLLIGARFVPKRACVDGRRDDR